MLKKCIKIIIILVIFITILICIFRPLVIKTENINEYLFGDRLITATNIPYDYRGFTLWNGYSIITTRYYSLPKIEVTDEKVEDIFLKLVELPYSDGQADPNKIWEEGGNCQSFSIYLKTALDKMGIKNGYFPMPDHVCLWVIHKNTLWRVDIVTREFAMVSTRDRLFLEQYINLEGIE